VALVSGHADVVERARAFAQEVVAPRTLGWERDGRYPRAAARDSGLTGLFAPAGGGGLDLPFPAGMAVFEELGRADAAFAFTLSMHNAVASAVCRAGAESVARDHGDALVRGERLGGFSLTEPHAGSDATAITTRAAEADGGWRVSGHKAWVSLAGEADLFLVVCKTADAPGHRDVAILVVERSAPGVSFGEPYRKAAAHHLPIADMHLDNAPAKMLVPPGAGMQAALGAIDVARCDIAAIACGLHAAAIDEALRAAAARHAFGGRVLDLQAIRFMLADAATDLVASRLLVAQAAERLGTPEGRVAVAHAKRFAPDAALRAAVACSEVLGARGWLEEPPLTRAIAFAKMLAVVDGTAEIQRLVIARELEARARTLAGAGEPGG
jgi:alkylation response protein AidB-like acyl-CoA dehydrogenase